MNRKSLFLYFLLALGFRLVFFLVLNHSKLNQLPEFIGELTPDSYGYLEPIDRLFETGKFYSSHRMPGYSLVYFILSLFFNQELSLNLLVIFQIAMSALSCLLLAQLGFLISGKKWVFRATFFFTLLSTYLTWYDGYVLTESLTISVLVILVFVFIKYSIEKRDWVWMLFPGFLFAWLVFLRPVFFPLGLMFFLLLLKKKSDWKSFAFQILSLFFPFLIAESLWVIANYQWHHRFVPFQESFLGPSQSNVFFEPAFSFIQSWGGNYLWWEPGAHIRYFGVGTDSTEYYDKESIRFPEAIFTSRFNLDSLKLMSEKLVELKLNKANWNDSLFNQSAVQVYNSFDIYETSIRNEHPFLFHFGSRFSLMDQFLFTSKGRNPFYKLDFPYRDFFIRIKSYSYILTLVMGYLSSFILLFFLKKQPYYLLVIGIVWYTLLIHPIILRVIENRYLLPSFSFLILSIVLASFELLKYYRLGK